METLQQMLGVTAVLGLLAVTLWWLRRRGLAYMPGMPARRKGGLLEPIEKLPLSPTHTLHLVRFRDRAVLLATSPSGCQLVESAAWRELDQQAAEVRR